MITPSRDRMATKSRGAGYQQDNILPAFHRKDQLPQGEADDYAKLPLTP
jgi:hypothetical protein